MILYHTSSHELKDALVACGQPECGSAGRGPHICWATEPLRGNGDLVYSIDLPLAEIQQYEYENEFRAEEQVRFFALPTDLVKLEDVKTETYEEATGQSSTRWVVPVLDKRNVRTPRLKGKWALIWASRGGIFGARVHRSQKDRAGTLTYLTVEITASEDYNPDKDYLVLEEHEEFDVPSTGRTKETWKVRTMAGRTPDWVIFPKRWNQWVWNRRVQESAVEYIKQKVPSIARDVDFAFTRTSKVNKARAWREVIDDAGVALSRMLGRQVWLGKLVGHSQTKVTSSPMVIAERIAGQLGQPWVPPIPKPVYADPEASGRYLLANLYGAYPMQGPGVDHAPQERPYKGLEGELSEDDPFELGREESSTLSGPGQPALAGLGYVTT